MFQTDGLAIDHFKDVPGFKGLLKAILKHQIQVLVEQLSKHADEETIVLSASLVDGGLSHLGSGAAKDFLEEKEEIKIQFLRHCLTNHHRQETVALPASGYQDIMTSRNQPPAAVYTHVTEHSSGSSSSGTEPVYNRTYPPPRNKGRKRSHPQHIKPSPTTPVVQYSQDQGMDLSNHASKKNNKHTSSLTSSSTAGNHVLSPSHPRSPQLHTNPVAMVKVEAASNSEHDLSHNEKGIDLTTHSKLNSSPSTHHRMSIEKEKISSSPYSSRTHSVSPPSTISKTESVEKMPIKLEPDLDYESEGTGVNQESSMQVETVANDHTSSRNDVDMSLEVVSAGGEVYDTSGISMEVLQGLEAGVESPHVGTLYNTFHGVSMLDPPFSHAFGFRPPPQKKRVYRKVECDICHKMIYITNIKVHKLRHSRNGSTVNS